MKETLQTKKQTKKQRIELIDALRGLAVILMVIHHFLFDLVTFLDAPAQLFSNPVFDVLHYVFAGTFIVLCGVSSNFSRSNLKRGVVTLVFALVISTVTFLMNMPIVFGVLHLLAFCMLFYALTHKLWEALPKYITPVFCTACGVLSAWCVRNIAVESDKLWIFGWTYKGFVSYDYFPLFPWLFVFLFGAWMGYYVKEHKFPKWFYTVKVPLLPAVGRHALIIYMLHQPVLYLLTIVIKKLAAG